MFMGAGSHDNRGARVAAKKRGTDCRIYDADVLRCFRAVVLRLVLVAELLARIAHRIGKRVETLARNGDGVALLVTGLPHPLAAMATDGLELDFHAAGRCKALHRSSPSFVPPTFVFDGAEGR